MKHENPHHPTSPANRSKARLLFVAPTPPPFAGPEVVSAALLHNEELQSRYEIRHLRSNINHHNRDKGKLHFSSIFRFMIIIVKFAQALKIYIPDGIYTLLAQNRVGFVRDAVYIYLGSLSGAKIFCQFHGESFSIFFERQPTFFQRFIKSIMGRIDVLMVQGENLKNQFFEIVDSARFRVIPNGVETSLYPAEDIDNRCFETERIGVLFLSSLLASKGFADLYEVAKEIADGALNIDFIFAGELCSRDYNITRDHRGHRFKPLKISEEIGNHRRIRFVGPVYDRAKIDLMLSADIFAFPSYSESFPTVVLEAMAAGLPMVVTPVGALPEVLKEGENCYFVSPGNKEELKERILRLAADQELRKRMSRANRELVCTEFTVGAMQRKFNKVLDECYNSHINAFSTVSSAATVN